MRRFCLLRSLALAHTHTRHATLLSVLLHLHVGGEDGDENEDETEDEDNEDEDEDDDYDDDDDGDDDDHVDETNVSFLVPFNSPYKMFEKRQQSRASPRPGTLF